uniref:Putative secreted protein n=1 Tax=Anopheles darlingi TaxID=43151 RepID=A0A2M4DBF1_ANODA
MINELLQLVCFFGFLMCQTLFNLFIKQIVGLDKNCSIFKRRSSERVHNVCVHAPTLLLLQRVRHVRAKKQLQLNV